MRLLDLCTLDYYSLQFLPSSQAFCALSLTYDKRKSLLFWANFWLLVLTFRAAEHLSQHLIDVRPKDDTLHQECMSWMRSLHRSADIQRILEKKPAVWLLSVLRSHIPSNLPHSVRPCSIFISFKKPIPMRTTLCLTKCALLANSAAQKLLKSQRSTHSSIRSPSSREHRVQKKRLLANLDRKKTHPFDQC